MAHFYKYVTASTGLAILQNRTLRWGSPPTLNDPFDMQFDLQLRVDREAVRRRAADKQWDHLNGRLLDRPLNRLGRLIRTGAARYRNREHFDEEFEKGFNGSFDVAASTIGRLNRDIRDFVANDKIFCVSAVPDNIPMWAYYAGNHSGFVLRFNSDVPESPLSEARPVNYTDEMPSIFNEDVMSDFFAGYGDLERDLILNLVVYTKFRAWEHEREWRVYSGMGRTRESFEDVPFNELELDGVIFGTRVADADREAAIRLVRARYPHAELLIAVPQSERYQLDIRRFP